MATFDHSMFDVNPEQQASFTRFMYHQLTVRPGPITGANLQGKTAIVTGSNTGLGFATARQLLDLGLSRLILAVRDEEKGNRAKTVLLDGRDMGKENFNVEAWKLDYSSYDSVVAFAARAEEELTSLDIVILNAGIGPSTRKFNEKTGHDQVIQVNYLSTALLAILLLRVFKTKRGQSGPGLMTLLSSELAAFTPYKELQPLPPSIFGALDDETAQVDMMDRMMLSKLLGQFFLVELAKVVSPKLVVINAVSPGSVYGTEFNRDREGTVSLAIVKAVMRRVGNSPSAGARMVVDAAVSQGEDSHGQFLSFMKMVPLAPVIYTDEGSKICRKLWDETLAEISFAGVEDILKSLAL